MPGEKSLIVIVPGWATPFQLVAVGRTPAKAVFDFRGPLQQIEQSTEEQLVMIQVAGLEAY
jgi:hypothetical protein